MKKIYIVLTNTGTILSKIIKFYTRDQYSHVSISLDCNLKKMYSFGRLNPYNPFYGGFVHEYIDRGTFKRFKKTVAIIYSLNITENQYKNLNNIILKMKKTKSTYKFNVLGLFAVAIHKKIQYKDSFYCAEFVKYVLEQSMVRTNLPELIKPSDFKMLSGVTKIYEGLLKEYNNSNIIALDSINYEQVS